MARFNVSREIEGGETLTVEQCNSWDEAFGLLDKGEYDRGLQLKHEAKIKAEEEAEKEPEEEAEEESSDTPDVNFSSEGGGNGGGGSMGPYGPPQV